MHEFTAPPDRQSPTSPDLQAVEPVDSAAAARILVVEDDFLIATDMESALTEAGFEVAVAGSAEQALAIAASDRPSLVVMDIRLSGALDGIDAALELFRRYGLRSVFATAHSDPAAQARAAPAQPLGWLVKPYTSASLVAVVRTALRLS
ncbi:response regulator [Mesorhizobium sp. BAC0120]|uniref:response regulator n=1 Tax=Mesorhizobium sp. BAC0120 TaxID=3090670 RepID=UPI00298C8B98|nr:response regulator [Mesorhizobium sp. BAC0120]MDW6020261.1 response regulator [Mesorhizobium sp. BAC0120]